MNTFGKDINWNTKESKQLIEAILALKNADETRRFFRDLMTKGEIEEFASRLEVARLLTHDIRYNVISESTGLSSTTIARIQKWLKGSLGGYRLILDRLAPSTSLRINSEHHHNSSKLGKGLSLNS